MVGYAFLRAMPITIFKEVDSKIFKRCDHFKTIPVQMKIMTCVSMFSRSLLLALEFDNNLYQTKLLVTIRVTSRKLLGHPHRAVEKNIFKCKDII